MVVTSMLPRGPAGAKAGASLLTRDGVAARRHAGDRSRTSLSRVPAIACASLLAAALLGCSPRRLAYFPPPPPETPEGTEASLAASLARMQSQVGMNPGGVWEATAFSQILATAFERGMVQRRGWNGGMLVARALSALAAAEKESPADRAELLSAKGRLLIAAGRVEDGVAALRASMDEKPSPGACDALIGVLDAGRREGGRDRREKERALPHAARISRPAVE